MGEEAYLNDLAPPPPSDPADRTSVAADMAAIFGEARTGASPLAAARRSPVAPVRYGRRIAVALGAISVLAAAAGVTLFGLARDPDVAPPPAAPAARVMLGRPAPIGMTPPPSAPIAPPVAPADERPSAATASAIAADRRPARVDTSLPARPAATPRVASGRKDEAKPRVKPRDETGPKAGIRAKGAARPREQSAAAGPCPGMVADARYACTLDALAAADGRLRRAYDSAVVTGVPHRALVEVRGDWNALRPEARQRPLWVIRRYDALAARLRALSSRAQ